MVADLILYNIGQLITSRELQNYNGTSMENIEILENAYIAIKDGKILEVGKNNFSNSLINLNTHLIDVERKVVSPGLIDSHTHLVHAGSRENEYSLKLKGATYLDILEAGGGILNTVKETRKASTEKLLENSKQILDRMLSYGITTIEAKSGYGLQLETEIKQLQTAKILNEIHPIDIISTFMGAHAVPIEFKGKNQEYLEEVKKMMLEVKRQDLAQFCDIFCEKNVFSIEESREFLKEAKEIGFEIKIHADEIESLGGAELAGEIGATSADHIMAISEKGIDVLAQKNIIGNLLPGTSFNLGKAYAPARKMIEKGMQLALSTDYNPGSCPTENLQLIMQMAASQLKMSPKEIFKAVTINAAKALKKEAICGSIEVGKKADIVIFDAPNIDFILYRFGINHTKYVFKDGNLVYKRR